MDVDGDELLTEMDRQAHLIEMMQKSQQMEPPDLSTIMAEMDGDGDGYVTETELADAPGQDGTERNEVALERLRADGRDGHRRGRGWSTRPNWRPTSPRCSRTPR